MIEPGLGMEEAAGLFQDIPASCRYQIRLPEQECETRRLLELRLAFTDDEVGVEDTLGMWHQPCL
jgi:hypothetical protein